MLVITPLKLHSNSNASDYIIMSYLSLWASDDHLFRVTVEGSGHWSLRFPIGRGWQKWGVSHRTDEEHPLVPRIKLDLCDGKRKQSSASPLTTSHNTTFQSVAALSSFLPVLFQLREVMRWTWWLHWREIPLVMKSQRAIRPSLQPATASIVPRLLNWVMSSLASQTLPALMILGWTAPIS